MLVRDMLSGELHEVPDYGEAPDPQVYGLGEVYDGYGNSLGLFFLPKLISAAKNLFKGGGGGGGGAAPPPANCPPCPPCPQLGPPGGPGMMRPGFPYPYPPRRRRRRR